MNIASKTDDRIPVTVLNGFLGSGKTMLLKRWLSQEPVADTLPQAILKQFL